MYLRKTTNKLEVSIDEPLNVDWDGNELLLSDILGTDEDVISKGIESEVEKKLLYKAIEKLNHREKVIVEMRYGLNNKDGEEMNTKRSRRSAWDFAVIHIEVRKKRSCRD